MPTYTYVCTACGAGIERRQSFSEPALTTCETCSGQLRRVVHPVGVIFKGSGFYNTDYKNSNGRNGSSDKDKEEGAKKSDDTKPAETTAASTSSGEGVKASESGASSSTTGTSGASGSGSAPPAAASKS